MYCNGQSGDAGMQGGGVKVGVLGGSTAGTVR